MMISFLACGILFVLLFLHNCAYAQHYYEHTSQLAKSARNTFLQLIKPKFMQAMSAEEIALMNSIDFRFPGGGGAFDAYANKNKDGPFVVIAGGFVLFQDALADAATISYHFGRSGQMMGYVDEALEGGRQNIARMRVGAEPKVIIAIENYLSVSIGNYRESDDYNRRMAFLRTEGLAMIIGHEIAHHLHGDIGDKRSSPSEQVAKETKADQYAMLLGARSGFNPVAAAPLMMGFVAEGGDEDHPPPFCRFANFMIVGIREMNKDSAFKEYLAKHPDAKATMLQWNEALRVNANDIEHDCLNWLTVRP